LQFLTLKIPIISLAKREEEIYVPGLDGPLDIGKEEESFALSPGDQGRGAQICLGL